MGYACPVCEDPQADATHLANHLAFTAMLRGGEHETWLADTVPDWDERGEASLAEALAEVVPETEYPQVFDDEGLAPDQQPPTRAPDWPPADDEPTREALSEAADLTRARRDESETE